MKGELEELGEESEGVENISKMQGQILNMTHGKVNIFGDNGEFRSTYDIMKDIAEVYDELSSTDQANLLETIAGKNRANDVAALISNFDTAINMVETAENSAGSAAQENAKYLDSLQGRIDVMTASFQALSTSAVDSGFLKGAISGITILIDGISSLIDTFGLIPTVATAASAAFAAFGNKGVVTVDKANGKLNVFGKSFQKLGDIITAFRMFGAEGGINVALSGGNVFKDFSVGLEKDMLALQNYQNLVASGIPRQEAFNNSMMNASESAKSWANSVDISTANLDDFSASQRKNILELQASDKSFKSINSIFKEYNNHGKNIQMTQAEMAETIGNTNSVMGNYLKGLNGANATMGGYAKALIGATAKTVGLTVASTALNAVLTMGIGVAISAAIGWISDLITYYDDLAKSVDESTSTFKQANDSMMQNKSSYDSAVQSYDKLSKGVNSLGENVSLTADEYAEYQNAVNTIAEAVPSMVSGFDSQGNAILNTKANVESLTEAYNELIATEARAFINGDEDKGYVGLDKIAEDWAHERAKLSNNNTAVYDIEANRELQKLLTSDNLEKSIAELAKNSPEILTDIGNQFSDWGIDTKDDNESYQTFIKETIKNNTKEVQEAANEYGAQLDDISQGLNQQAQAFLNEAFYDDSKLGNLNDATKNAISQYVSSFDGEFYDNLVAENGGDRGKVGEYLETYMNDLFGGLEKLTPDQQQTIADAFNARLDFESGDISMDEFYDKAKEMDKVLKDIGLDKDARKDMMLSIGFEYNNKDNLKKFTKDYETVKNRFKDFENQSEIEDWLGGLSGSELDIVMGMELDGNETVDELQRALDLTKTLNGVDDIDIGIVTDGIDKLNTALEESNSATGLTSESIDALSNRYADLDGADKIFVKTANGIKLNRQEAAKLEDEYKDSLVKDVDDDIAALSEEYNNLTEEIGRASNASERASLMAERDTYGDRIEELSRYKAQLEAATNAYNEWQAAQSRPDEREEYANIASERSNIEEEMKRGWLDEGSKAYIDMLSAQDLSNATFDEYMAEWNRFKNSLEGTKFSINDFFTVDEDGKETTEGIYNFFDAVNQAFGDGYASIDENGKYTFDFGDGKLEDIVNKWQLSEEAIQSILEGAVDAGFEIDWDSLYEGIDLATTDFDTLVAAAEAAQTSLNDITGEEYSFNFTAENVEDATDEFEKAKEAYEDLITNDDGTVNIDAEGAEEMRTILLALLRQKHDLESEDTIMSVEVDASQADTEIGQFISGIQNLQGQMWLLEQAEIDPSINTADVNAQIGDIITQLMLLETQNPTIWADLGLDESQAAAVQAAITNINADINAGFELDPSDLATVQSTISNIPATVTANVLTGNTSGLGSLTGTASITPTPTTTDLGSGFTGDGTINVKPNTTNLGSNFTGSGQVSLRATLTNPTVTVTVKENRVSQADGTAHVNGTAGSTGRAFKQGDWSTKDSGTALVGELGQETVVRNGHFFTIGDNGAEFFNYKKGDIIFNHRQTEELFKNGYVTSNGGRGRAYAEGTAFISGSGPSRPGSGGIGGGYSSSNKGSSSSKKKSSSNKSSTKQATEDAKEFEEVFDLIEIMIDRVERAIDRLDRTASSTFKTWTDRTKALNDQITKTRQEIDLQNKAYNRYLQQASQVGLSSDWVSKVQNGKVDIETITDEDLADKIKEYQDWYEKALDCKDAIDELRESESELYNQRFENVSTKYEGILGTYQHEADMLEESISQSEARGWVVSGKYYEELIKNQQSQTEQLKKQRQEMLNEMKSGLESGAIKRGSEEWYNQINAIDEVTKAIKEGETAILEYENSIREINWSVFDMIQEQISNITTEADFLIDLMSNKKLYEDNGQLTNEGLASMGLHGQNYTAYMYQSDKYAEEIAKLDSQIASDPYDQELIKRRQELLELQQESILNAEQEKEAIRDLVSDGIDKELDSLQSLIDKRNEALDSQKD